MTHFLLSSSLEGGAVQPKLSRIQLTTSNKLLLLLSLEASIRSNSQDNENGARHHESVGGSIQGFVYDRKSELWLRMSDGRFVLSDFYSTLPSKSSMKGELSGIEDAVRLGSSHSSLKATQRGRLSGSDRQANALYNQDEEASSNFIATRSHCEDRMSCSLALGSVAEFKHWLTLYVRALAVAGDVSMVRMLVDMLLSRSDGDSSIESSNWWVSALDVLGLDRKELVKACVLPEALKNRSLQRLTNEISLEINSL
jgi:protein HIRA/HIR1